MQQRSALGIGQLPPPPLPGAPAEEKLDYMIRQLQRMVLLGEQLIGQVPIVIEPKLLLAQIAIHLEPRTIGDFIQAVAPLGKIAAYAVAIPIVCPAGVTTQWSFRLPSGWVSVIRAGYVYSSNYYGPDLTMQIWIEESRIPVTFGAIPLTGPRNMAMDFVVKKYGMDAEFVNTSATDALVTLELQAFWLEKSYYEDFYHPLVNKLYQAVEELVR